MKARARSLTRAAHRIESSIASAFSRLIFSTLASRSRNAGPQRPWKTPVTSMRGAWVLVPRPTTIVNFAAWPLIFTSLVEVLPSSIGSALALVEPLLPHRLLHRLLHLRCTLPLKRLAEAHQRQAAPRGIVGIPHDARYGLVGEGNLQVQRKDGLQRLGNADVGNRLGRFFHGRRTRDNRIPKPKE